LKTRHFEEQVIKSVSSCFHDYESMARQVARAVPNTARTGPNTLIQAIISYDHLSVTLMPQDAAKSSSNLVSFGSSL
jgi:hypothetical protein